MSKVERVTEDKTTTHPTERKLNDETLFILRIFQNAYSCEGDPDGLGEYLKQHKHAIERIGEIFSWLGLAIYHKDAPLGWRPASRFNDLIAKRIVRQKVSKKEPNAVDLAIERLFVDLSDDAMARKGGPRGSDANFCLHVLGALGLLRDTEEGTWKATKKLRRFMREGGEPPLPSH